MNKNNYTYFIIVFFAFFTSCKNNKVSYAYFTGQIANTKEKSIHLLKNNHEIYNTTLNSNNNFFIKIDSVKEGLFSFKHGNEIQYFYLEPKDSLVMRLNTWDFDESLIFSGKGAVKNNYLMHLFLENEKQEKLFYKYYNLNEEDFKHKTDSLLQIKLLSLKQFKENNTKTSKKFEDLIFLAIYYPIYTQMEKFADRKQKNGQKLSASFYSYRKNVKINRKNFTDFYAYRNYVKNYFINKANKIAFKKNEKSNSLILLNQINKELQNSDFKDDLLQNATLNCILDENCNFNKKQKAINIFYNNCKNTKKIQEIKNINNSMQYIQKGNKLPKLTLVDYNGKSFVINKNSLNKNTVIYFWPKERPRILYMLKRLKYLEKKYTDINFIGIDSQLDTYNWKSYLKNNHLNVKNQFKLKSQNAKNWFCNELPRAILIDKNGFIKNDFSYLAQNDFEKLLKKLSEF